MALGYWERITTTRLGRRRALGVGAGFVAGVAAFSLVGCGSSKSGSQGQSSGAGGLQISQPVDTTGQAKPGGVLKDYFTADILTWDALQSNSSSTVNQVSVFTYPRLLKFTVVPAGKTNDGTVVEGDAMES